MEPRRVVEIKRRQRLSGAALSKLEAGGFAELMRAEAEAIRRLVRGDVEELVAEATRLDEELTEAKRLFREADPGLYEWYLGDDARERREQRRKFREAALDARRASYRLEERGVELERRARGRRPGSATGRIVVHDDFNDPLPEEMLAAFEGREAGREAASGPPEREAGEGEGEV